MVKCPICGKNYEDGVKFCPDCGIKMEQPKPANIYSADESAGEQVLSVRDYVLMDLVAKIPVVRLIMYFIWGFSSDTDASKKNWSRAKLIWTAIGLAFSIVSLILIAAGGFALLTAMKQTAPIIEDAISAIQ